MSKIAFLVLDNKNGKPYVENLMKAILCDD